MKKINENQTLTTVHLSDVQKMVLSKIIAAATPQSALEDISNGRNLVQARNLLAKLGLITFTANDANVTDEGREVMKDENLADEAGSLTPDGEKYSQAAKPEDLKGDEEQGMGDEEAPLGGEDMGGDEMDMGGDELDLGGDEDMPPKKGVDKGLDLGEGAIPLLREIAGREYMKRKITEMNSYVEFTPAEINIIKDAAAGDDEELNDKLMEKIYEWVVTHDPTWMPYGTQKARDGDPHEWIYDHLEEIAGILSRI